MEALYEPIARTLLEWTGKNHAALLPSHLVRASIALIAVSITAAVTRDHITERTGELLGALGLAILIYDILSGSSPLMLGLGTALNVLLIGLVGIGAFKVRFITNAHLKLLVGLALVIPLHPLLIVFPLAPPLFDAPFNIFGIPLLINLCLLLAVYALYNAVRTPPWKSPPLTTAFAERVPVESIHTHDGFICYTSDGRVTVKGLSGDDIAAYLDWRNENDTLPDAASLADIDAPYLDRYLTHHDIDVSDDVVAERSDYLTDLSNSDTVWMSKGPAPEPFILATLVLSLVIGTVPLYLLA